MLLERGPQQGLPKGQHPFRTCAISFVRSGKSAIRSTTSLGMLVAMVVPVRNEASAVQEKIFARGSNHYDVAPPRTLHYIHYLTNLVLGVTGVVHWGEVNQLVR